MPLSKELPNVLLDQRYEKPLIIFIFDNRYLDRIKEAKKGIPHSWRLELRDFLDTLYGNNDKHSVEVRSLRLNNDRKMTRTTLRKYGLSDIHVKMAVQSDRVQCLPLRENGFII